MSNRRSKAVRFLDDGPRAHRLRRVGWHSLHVRTASGTTSTSRVLREARCDAASAPCRRPNTAPASPNAASASSNGSSASPRTSPAPGIRALRPAESFLVLRIAAPVLARAHLLPGSTLLVVAESLLVLRIAAREDGERVRATSSASKSLLSGRAYGYIRCRFAPRSRLGQAPQKRPLHATPKPSGPHSTPRSEVRRRGPDVTRSQVPTPAEIPASAKPPISTASPAVAVVA
jgi:hypothetical protein